MERENDIGLRWWRLPIGAGQSYPLTRTTFDHALETTPVRGLREVHLGHARSRSPAEYFRGIGFRRPPRVEGAFTPVLTARWSGVADATAEPFSSKLTVYAVPSSRRAELVRVVRDAALPEALSWLAGLEAGPDTARTERRRLAMYLVDDRLEQAAE